MKKNPLIQVNEFGQSIWLDFISKKILDDGTLQKLINEDGLRGITSNPSIFSKDITEGDAYHKIIGELAAEGKSVEDIYQAIAIVDVQRAADIFRPVYDQTNGKDGYVSLEVSPKLARKTDETIKEARMLWEKVDRPNIFIKIPGTKEGLKAIRTCISDGINVNVTLLFGLIRYKDVTDAYLSGLEDRLAKGNSIDKIHSVASFFLSRIDVKLDPVLDQMRDSTVAILADRFYGNVAISEAKEAYQIYKSVFSSDRFETLRKKGANAQRVLWASTSTKEDEFSDVKYVDELIGADTVNTIPMKTLEAYRDHGKPEIRLENDLEDAQYLLKNIDRMDIDLSEVSDELEEEGIRKFVEPYEKILKVLKKKREEILSAESR